MKTINYVISLANQLGITVKPMSQNPDADDFDKYASMGMFTAPTNTIWYSDLLNLEPHEIAMTIAHEIGHWTGQKHLLNRRSYVNKHSDDTRQLGRNEEYFADYFAVRFNEEFKYWLNRAEILKEHKKYVRYLSANDLFAIQQQVDQAIIWIRNRLITNYLKEIRYEVSANDFSIRSNGRLRNGQLNVR